MLPARDGYVELLTLEPRQWESLSRWLGNPDWAASEKFLEPAKYGPEINAGLRQWSAEHTKEWLYHEGQSHGVPIAPYYSPAEVSQSPQQRERDQFLPLDHPEAGSLEYPGFPCDSETPRRTCAAPPCSVSTTSRLIPAWATQGRTCQTWPGPGSYEG